MATRAPRRDATRDETTTQHTAVHNQNQNNIIIICWRSVSFFAFYAREDEAVASRETAMD
jgi:hypothetical protein